MSLAEDDEVFRKRKTKQIEDLLVEYHAARRDEMAAFDRAREERRKRQYRAVNMLTSDCGLTHEAAGVKLGVSGVRIGQILRGL